MNRDEKIAEKYLKSLKLHSIRYEPNGNIPPDFLINEAIAVEVRRLNKNIEVNGKKEGIEQAEIPLLKLVERTLDKLKYLYDGRSFFISLKFNRPLPSSKNVANILEKNLIKFHSSKKEYDEQRLDSNLGCLKDS